MIQNYRLLPSIHAQNCHPPQLMLNYNLLQLGITMKHLKHTMIVITLTLPLTLGACSVNNGQGVRPTASVLIGK